PSSAYYDPTANVLKTWVSIPVVLDLLRRPAQMSAGANLQVGVSFPVVLDLLRRPHVARNSRPPLVLASALALPLSLLPSHPVPASPCPSVRCRNYPWA